MPADLTAARAFQSELHALLAAIPAYGPKISLEEQEARTLALRKLQEAITAKGGKVQDRWDGGRISLYGLRASSTQGIAAACRNWLAQLTLKCMEAQP